MHLVEDPFLRMFFETILRPQVGPLNVTALCKSISAYLSA